jgi:hypothetical protein
MCSSTACRPTHSHHWITDGTFSVMEGWLCHDGFPGCATIWDLIDFLRSQFAKADGYKDKEVGAAAARNSRQFHPWQPATLGSFTPGSPQLSAVSPLAARNSPLAARNFQQFHPWQPATLVVLGGGHCPAGHLCNYQVV